ncbi:MAG TPA: AAA family ATPase [Blastocatellia bacterium]|nr:AAA family ATPase [Blastocatellia bacterium]
MNGSAREISTREGEEVAQKIPLAPEWTDEDRPIQIIETHISTVFLGQNHVLKMKKPVNFGFLDYTTLEKRLEACRAEVELNRRLSPHVYLRVQPVSEIDGVLHLSGAGQIVDYGVLMRRLPADRMLDHLVANGLVTEAMIERVSERLCSFHENARRGPEIDRYGSIETIRGNWTESFEQVAPYAGRTIDPEPLRRIEDWVFSGLEEMRPLFEQRVRSGRIRDGHGDLRCESVCMTGETPPGDIVIFDCIEFNDRFRYADVSSEVAFLSMDLDIRGRPDLGYYFAECYKARSGDSDLFSLLPFYKCYRAFVRGKVLSFRLDQPGLSDGEKHSAHARARVYFDYARRYSNLPPCPFVVAVGGLSGTGKTSLARAIASELGLKVISADRVRKSIFGDELADQRYGEGAYSPAANVTTYSKMLEMASESMKLGRPVVLDATFRRRPDREAARELASSLGAAFRLIICQLAPSLIKERLDKRRRLKDGHSDARWETYLRQRNEFDPVDRSKFGTAGRYESTVAGCQESATLNLNTERALSHCAREATDWLRSTLSH